MKEVIVERDELLNLIPQRPPIVMVDKFYGFEGDSSFTGLDIESDNIFIDNDYMSEPGLIEHLAQSAAVRAGYRFLLQKKDIPLGFIASVDKLTVHQLPSPGEILYTEIRQIQQVENITLIEARSESDGNLLIECKMKIFLDLG